MFFILPIIFTALAAFFSLNSSIALIAVFFIVKKLLFGGLFLTCGLPTLAGVATFALIQKTATSSTKYLRVALQLIVPLFCMILFVCHPVSRPAFLYSFYWFIPMILYFINRKNIFVASLSSTFVAHAVGSIMWLFSTNMAADKWLALIPVVAFERLSAAFGILVCYGIFKSLLGLIPGLQRQM